MDSPPAYQREQLIAELAVQRGAQHTKKLFNSVKTGVLCKTDSTPVTLGDFAIQALIVGAISEAFPDDDVLGEEDAGELRANEKLTNEVWELVQQTKLSDPESEELLGGRPKSVEHMLDLIDRAGKHSGMKGRGRLWVMDPIDGTKTFVNGTQYAIAVALVVDGSDVVSAVACPRFPYLDGKRPAISEEHCAIDGPGYIVSGVRGHGVHVRQLTDGALSSPRRLEKHEDVADLSKVRLVEASSGRLRFKSRREITDRLGIPWPPLDIHSAQVRVISIVVGAVDAQIMATEAIAKPSSVWDYAGAVMMVEEMGGSVTDLFGRKIWFGRGRRFKNAFGFIIAPANIHAEIVASSREVLLKIPEYSAIAKSSE